MIGKKIVRAAVLALAVAAPMAVATGTAHAAPGSDLDLTKCQIVDDPVNYGDGIDWYKLEYTYVNEGTAPTGAFALRVRPVYGVSEFSGQVENETHVKENVGSLNPGQSQQRLLLADEEGRRPEDLGHVPRHQPRHPGDADERQLLLVLRQQQLSRAGVDRKRRSLESVE